MRILLSNDDGIHSPSLRALYAALVDQGHEVRVVAPLTEQSGVSGAVTTHCPLRVHAVHDNGFSGQAVNGTPVDCVKLALTTLLEEQPDLVVSGINAGCNLGTDVYYSGTVGAATEAAMLGIPSIAFSRHMPEVEPPAACARHAAELVGMLNWSDIPSERLINVNYPQRPVAETLGVRVCRLSTTPWRERYLLREDPSGRPYWWISGWLQRPSGGEDTDIALVRDGWISLTPLDLDRTDRSLMTTLQKVFL